MIEIDDLKVWVYEPIENWNEIFMMHCAYCGHKIPFSLTPPKHCPECGTTMLNTEFMWLSEKAQMALGRRE